MQNEQNKNKFYLDFTESELREMLADWLFFPYKGNEGYDQEKRLREAKKDIKEATLKIVGEWVVITYSTGVVNYARYNEKAQDYFDYETPNSKNIYL